MLSSFFGSLKSFTVTCILVISDYLFYYFLGRQSIKSQELKCWKIDQDRMDQSLSPNCLQDLHHKSQDAP